MKNLSPFLFVSRSSSGCVVKAQRVRDAFVQLPRLERCQLRQEPGFKRYLNETAPIPWTGQHRRSAINKKVITTSQLCDQRW